MSECHFEYLSHADNFIGLTGNSSCMFFLRFDEIDLPGPFFR